jgi:hypothetical protein
MTPADLSPRHVARVLAAARVAIGLGLLAAPQRSLGIWLGSNAADRAVAPVGQALGAREIVLGAILLHTLDRPPIAVRWMRTLAACDAVDLGATVAAGRALPPFGRALIVAMASAGTAGHLWTAGRLAAAQPPDATAA